MKRRIPRLLSAGLVVLLSVTCAYGADKDKKKAFIDENVAYAAAQTEVMLVTTGEPNGRNFPRTIKRGDTFSGSNMYEWTSGFFPGTLWYLYELTGDSQWLTQAGKWTGALDSLKTYKGTHDLGFMIYCSFGNAERLKPSPEYRDVIVESANSLISRYSEKTKTIKSWNGYRGWDGETVFPYPVIIDNMMNLEMLFYASKITGDKKYYDIAVAHADATMKNHLRKDFSAYHVVGYDPETGEVQGRKTAQGLSDNSAWARGQAWAVYGFTMAYRETGDKRYLRAATGTVDYFLKNLPPDYVPYWDFNVGQPGYNPDKRSNALNYTGKERDASAAAIVCSALFDIAEFTGKAKYRKAAVRMLESLASPAYRSPLGENKGFLIMHCVGSVPHNVEIDAPLVYADYYFLEALARYRKMK